MHTAGTPEGVFPGSYVAYVVDANETLLLSTDSHATHVLLSGTAELQTPTGFSNGSLSGAMLGSVNATADPAPLAVALADVSSSATATVFRTTAAGDGSCAVTHVDVAGGTQLSAAVEAAGGSGPAATAVLSARSATGPVSCSVEADGRGLLTPATAAGTSRVFYLVAPDRGYFLETSYAALGSFEPQTAGAVSRGSLSGSYRYGTGTPSTAASVGSSGALQADGSGSATVTPDAGLSSGHASAQAAVSQTVPYALTDAVAGRFSVGSTVLYAISPDRLLRLDLTAGAASPAVGSVQR